MLHTMMLSENCTRVFQRPLDLSRITWACTKDQYRIGHIRTVLRQFGNHQSGSKFRFHLVKHGTHTQSNEEFPCAVRLKTRLRMFGTFCFNVEHCEPAAKLELSNNHTGQSPSLEADLCFSLTWIQIKYDNRFVEGTYYDWGAASQSEQRCQMLVCLQASIYAFWNQVVQRTWYVNTTCTQRDMTPTRGA